MNGRRRPLGLLLASVVSAVAVGGLVAFFGDEQDDISLGPSVLPELVEARDGVCRALDDARSRGPAAAHRTFVNRAHRPLHDLAAMTSGRDRQAAARLLEAKQRVEADFENGDGSLITDLEGLGAAAGVALSVVGGPRDNGCVLPAEDG